jgi:hypothetical protein
VIPLTAGIPLPKDTGRLNFLETGMKTVFGLAVIVGFGGTLAGAQFTPWLAHTRLPSQTTVIANGGRAEQFLIRLPADRIAATDAEAGGVRSAAGNGAMVLPARFVAEPLLVEHFKVRDSGGNVVGVAARHWSSTASGATTTWSVLIPSRGAMILSAPGEQRGVVEDALRAAARGPSRASNSGAIVAMTPLDAGTVTAGSGEFAGLSGNYSETWDVAGVDEAGHVNATIEISTVTRRPE